MQGRFSPLVSNKIQAFPWALWKQEFELAKAHGFSLMEWTLDRERLYENPLMTEQGQDEIRKLEEDSGLKIRSLTGDCFMQAPFYKATGKLQQEMLNELKDIIEACSKVEIKIILIPLVDNGRLENTDQEKEIEKCLSSMIPWLEKTHTMISFESDFAPKKLNDFIGRFDENHFGITYDIGNSASFGYDCEDEIVAYSERIINVHIKDRLFQGTTVPLGEGNAEFPRALRALNSQGYDGNYILQTARSKNNDHAGVLCKYRDMVLNWLVQNE